MFTSKSPTAAFDKFKLVSCLEPLQELVKGIFFQDVFIMLFIVKGVMDVMEVIWKIRRLCLW